MSRSSPTIALIDTHLTAVLAGVVTSEILSFLSFDIRLITAMVCKRQLRPMPLAYLIARYSMAIGILTLAWLTVPTTAPRLRDEGRVHWLRAIALPTIFTSTSAVIGYRASILHFERPRLVSRLIHCLLLSELVGGMIVSILAVSDPTNIAQRFNSISIYVSPAFLCAPLLIAMLIDIIFTLIVVIPILRDHPRPRKGEVVHMLLSDASFFGMFSIVVKAIAIGLTLKYSGRETNPYLPVRAECVASSIFACRIFRGQEEFLKEYRERKAKPYSLGVIELDDVSMSEVRRRLGDVEASGRREERDGDEDRARGKDSVEKVRTLTVRDCEREAGVGRESCEGGG